jgi:hypothetical protein
MTHKLCKMSIEWKNKVDSTRLKMLWNKDILLNNFITHPNSISYTNWPTQILTLYNENTSEAESVRLVPKTVLISQVLLKV